MQQKALSSIRHRLVTATAVACALALSGCGTACLLDGGTLFGGRAALDATFASDLNGNSPVPVDVVVVYDEGIHAKLLTLDANAWFDQKKQLAEDFPGTFEVAVHREWVPGTARQQERFQYNRCALATLVFAQYESPGAHRLVFDPGKAITLRLETWDVVQRDTLP